MYKHLESVHLRDRKYFFQDQNDCPESPFNFKRVCMYLQFSTLDCIGLQSLLSTKLTGANVIKHDDVLHQLYDGTQVEHFCGKCRHLNNVNIGLTLRTPEI